MLSHIPVEDAYSPINRLVRNRTISAVNQKEDLESLNKNSLFYNLHCDKNSTSQ